MVENINWALGTKERSGAGGRESITGSIFSGPSHHGRSHRAVLLCGVIDEVTFPGLG